MANAHREHSEIQGALRGISTGREGYGPTFAIAAFPHLQSTIPQPQQRRRPRYREGLPLRLLDCFGFTAAFACLLAVPVLLTATGFGGGRGGGSGAGFSTGEATKAVGDGMGIVSIAPVSSRLGLRKTSTKLHSMPMRRVVENVSALIHLRKSREAEENGNAGFHADDYLVDTEGCGGTLIGAVAAHPAQQLCSYSTVHMYIHPHIHPYIPLI